MNPLALPLAATLLALAPPSLPASGCAVPFLAEHLPRVAPASWLRSRKADQGTAGSLPSARHEAGSSREFWAWDLSVMPPGFRRVAATCRVVSDHAYLFVEDELAAAGKVTPSDVAALDTALHRATPGYSVAPGKGILELERRFLGEAPDTLDGDPRVYFLVLRMDTFNGMGFDGYFNAFDQMTEAEAWEQYQQHSNEAEVLYLNGARGDISGAYMRGVLAHELAHLIAHRYDGEEEPWLSEALGEAAMQLTGYYTDQKHVARYTTRPEKPLVSQGYADYGAGFLFSAWLRGLEGPEVWGDLIRDPGKGLVSVEAVLAARGHPVDFEDLYAAWAADNLAKGMGRRVAAYRHPGVSFPPFKVAHRIGAEGATLEGKLARWGYAFVELAPGGYHLEGQGDAAVFELLSGRPPRRVSLDTDGERLDTLDETRWLLLLGTGVDAYRLVVQAQ